MIPTLNECCGLPPGYHRLQPGIVCCRTAVEAMLGTCRDNNHAGNGPHRPGGLGQPLALFVPPSAYHEIRDFVELAKQARAECKYLTVVPVSINDSSDWLMVATGGVIFGNC